jgi:AcrR family transcriptional regulator
VTRRARAGQRGRPKNRELTQRRREQILDAAGRVFARRGYPNTDVQVVADDLAVGKGTIYRYFPSKRELFLAAVDRGMRRLQTHIEATLANVGDALERIARVTRAYLAFFDANPELVELLIQERAEFRDRKKPTYFEYQEANVGRLHQLLGRLIAAGRVRDVPVERIANVLGDVLYGTMFTNYFAGRRSSFEQQAEDILDVVFHGILSTREREARATAQRGTASRHKYGKSK